MFYRREIEELRKELRTVKADLNNFKLDYLTENGKYKFAIGDNIKLLSGDYKIHSKSYTEKYILTDSFNKETYRELRYEIKKQTGQDPLLTPIYVLVGTDNEDIKYYEEAELIGKLAEYKSQEHNFNNK